MSNNQETIASPCVRECGLNENGICNGCLRSADEIRGWNEAGYDERLKILDNIRLRQQAPD